MLRGKSKNYEEGFIITKSVTKELGLTKLPEKYRDGDLKYDLIGAIEETYAPKD
ncbi:MAG TPA: hypothetical protein VKI61_06170 [Chitinophagaceae bacterium]|jgi:hypothetical protein|nr:hypothetical protein [Chitinophagaceae bacterium]